VTLHLPEKTVNWVDNEAEILFSDYQPGNDDSWELGGKYWMWKDNGLVNKEKIIR